MWTFDALQTPDLDSPSSKDLSGNKAAEEALDLFMLMAEISKIDDLLANAELPQTQLDAATRQLGSEFILNPFCRTQRRLGDIDFEMISR